MKRLITIGALSGLWLLSAQAGICATAEQAGTYVGVVKGKRYVYATGEKLAWSSPLTVTIDLDNDVLIDGENGLGLDYVPGVGTFGLTDGFMRVSTANSGYVFTMHFKNGGIKGTATFGGTDGVSNMVEAKMSLKKQ